MGEAAAAEHQDFLAAQPGERLAEGRGAGGNDARHVLDLVGKGFDVGLRGKAGPVEHDVLRTGAGPEQQGDERAAGGKPGGDGLIAQGGRGAGGHEHEFIEVHAGRGVKRQDQREGNGFQDAGGTQPMTCTEVGVISKIMRISAGLRYG